VNLLEALLEAGGERAVDELVQRISAGINPGWFPDPLDVLRTLQRDGVEHTTNALARRAAAVIDVSRPLPVAVLLKALHEVDAKDAVAALLARAPADHVDPTDAVGAIQLLQGLRENGAHRATKILAHRAATHAHLTDPMAVAALLQELLMAGANQAIAALLDRAPATHADPTDPLGVADLLRALRHAGADQAADTLAHRAAPHTDLTHPYSVAQLLGELRLIGADQAADTLAHRAANAGFAVPDRLHPYGREVDGRPATPWTWNDLPFSC
jgi:hypothetical protein